MPSKPSIHISLLFLSLLLTFLSCLHTTPYQTGCCDKSFNRGYPIKFIYNKSANLPPPNQFCPEMYQSDCLNYSRIPGLIRIQSLAIFLPFLALNALFIFVFLEYFRSAHLAFTKKNVWPKYVFIAGTIMILVILLWQTYLIFHLPPATTTRTINTYSCRSYCPVGTSCQIEQSCNSPSIIKPEGPLSNGSCGSYQFTMTCHPWIKELMP